MKIRMLALFFSVAATVSVHAVTISQWTFESSPPADLTNSTTISGIAADSGNGSASGSHASAATDYSTPVGNGSANSLSANTWGINDYWQFQLSTVGFDSVSLSWDQTSSGTGPRDFGLFYSIDGSAFTQFGTNYTVLENGVPNPGWSTGTVQPAYAFSRDLSLVSALSDDASIFFRLVDLSAVSANGAAVAAGGTSRVDNFTVSGIARAAAVPESSPGFVGWLCLLAVLALAAKRLSFQVA